MAELIPGDWEKLEKLKSCIIDLVEGKSNVHLCTEELAHAIAGSIRSNDDEGDKAIVGNDITDPFNAGVVLVPKGAQIVLSPPGRHVKDNQAMRNYFADAAEAAIESQNVSCIRTRPLCTRLSPPFAMPKSMLRAKSLERYARGSSAAKVFNELSLFLWDAMFFARAVRWTTLGVQNLPAARTLLLGKCFMKGQNIGAQPLHDGICACCGELLHGVPGHGAMSNKAAGPPTDVDGEVLHDAPGALATDMQPPFLLRFSSSLLAREVPAVFVRDASTNRLSLRDGVGTPWLRFGRPTKSNEVWLYCKVCRATRVGSRKGQHIPFRDQNSQGCCSRLLLV